MFEYSKKNNKYLYLLTQNKKKYYHKIIDLNCKRQAFQKNL